MIMKIPVVKKSLRIQKAARPQEQQYDGSGGALP